MYSRILTVAIAAFLALAGPVCGLKEICKDPYVGAIVIDADTGTVLFEDNADQPAYPASVVKLLDLLIILEKIEDGKFKLTDWVHVTREAAGIGGTQVWLKEGESFTLDDMLAALMTKSANDVAVALAIHVAGSKANFVKLMNSRAKELGMNSSVFHSVHGLPPGRNDKQVTDMTTARDIATLSREVVKHKKALHYTSIIERMFRKDGVKGQVKMESHNPLLRDFEGCDGLKTGYFIKAGWSITVTAKRNGRRVIAVIMGSNNRDRRNLQVREMLTKGFLDLPPLERKPERKVAKMKPGEKSKSRPFRNKVKSFFKGILVFLLSIILLAAGVGIMLGLRWVYKRRRDNWKYRW